MHIKFGTICPQLGLSTMPIWENSSTRKLPKAGYKPKKTILNKKHIFYDSLEATATETSVVILTLLCQKLYSSNL